MLCFGTHARQRGDSFWSRPKSADGPLWSCRRAASRDDGVRGLRALLVVCPVSIRHREHVRTGGYSDGTGPGVMSGRRSLVHRNGMAPTWNAPRECSRPSFAQQAVLTCTLPATKKKAREGGFSLFEKMGEIHRVSWVPYWAHVRR